MFLLDTNVVSEVRKGRRADPNVSGWYAGVDESALFISSLTLGEIRRGIELVRQRGDVRQAETLEAWLYIDPPYGIRFNSYRRYVHGQPCAADRR